MRMITLVFAFVAGLIVPGFAQQAEIEAVNTKWIDFFNKGDFAGIARSIPKTPLPPGSHIVNGRAAIEVMWKRMAEEVADPKLIITDVKPLGSSAAREIGTFSLKAKGATPREVTGKYVVVWKRSVATGSSRPISGMKANRYIRQGHFR
jgi:ketosteroid isomerase-like protein